MARGGIIENPDRFEARALFGRLSGESLPVLLKRAHRIYFVAYAPLLGQ